MNPTDQQLYFVTTEDGSKTIFNAVVGENYHSRHGALQESRHVFLETGLIHFLKRNQANEASVLEVGFGTGLNFLLSADYCTKHQIQLNYTGIEAYPLSAEMAAATGYDRYMTTATWDNFITHYSNALIGPANLNTLCELQIIHAELKDFRSLQRFDVIYYDAFAAAYQPGMWTDEAIVHAAGFLSPGGVFVTYAITGNLKRLFKSHGYNVEKAPGAAGKREMLRATKP